MPVSCLSRVAQEHGGEAWATCLEPFSSLSSGAGVSSASPGLSSLPLDLCDLLNCRIWCYLHGVTLSGPLGE